MFHLSTVKEETYITLKEIFSIPEIKERFALAGGTSLALQLGHRYSIDLNIFSPTSFDTKEMEIILSQYPNINFELVNSNKNMLFGYANKIKCDLICEPAKLIQPFIEHGTLYKNLG